MRLPQNLPLPPRIYSPFSSIIILCALQESTPPPFLPTIWDPPRIYPSIPEYTPPPFNNYNIMRPSHNVPLPHKIHPLSNEFICATLPKSTTSPLPPSLPPRIYPLFQQLYETLPESTPPSQNIPPFNKFICATIPKSTPPSQNNPPSFNSYKIMRPSQNLSRPSRIYPPPLSTTIRYCDPPSICPSPPPRICSQLWERVVDSHYKM